MNAKPSIQIELTPEQKEQVRKLTGQEVPHVKLNLEVLETRLTPILGTN
jgi:hypothetical protein